MWASSRAEWLKIRKRRALQVLLLLIVGINILSSYGLSYWLYRGAQGGVTPWGGIAEQSLLDLLPGKLIQQALVGSFFASVLTLILGVLVAGSEYGWGTLKTVLTRRPSRLAVYGGKVLALGLMVTLIVLALFVAGAVASTLVAATESEVAQHVSAPDLTARIDAAIPFGITYAQQEAARIANELPLALHWPPALEIVKAVGATWLILATFAAFGLFLGTATRGTALASGLGLVWVLVIERQIQNRASFDSSVQGIARWLLNTNASELAIPLFTDSPTLIDVSPLQAALVLAGYTALFLVLGALLLRTRDVT